ncbi:MAG: ankyrin repeat domain-containing protein [Spirochaetaceae bacterium]
MDHPRRLKSITMLFLLSGLLLMPVAVAKPQERARTPLHWAARRGHEQVVELLLERGANVDAQDALGRTPLHVAVGHPAVVRLLLENGAAVDSRDHLSNTPLHRAVRTPEVVEALIEAGADVRAENIAGDTALDVAMRYGSSRRNLRVVERLVEAGAGVE